MPKFVLVSGVTRECSAMIGSTILSIIAMIIYVTFAHQKYDNINVFYFVLRVTWTPNSGVGVTRDLLACYLDTKYASKED